MKKKLIRLLSVCMLSLFIIGSLNIKSVSADYSTTHDSYNEDENKSSEPSVINDDGIITRVDGNEAGIVHSNKTIRSSTTPAIVNFNTKGSATTEYVEDVTNISGYTNGAYAADAGFLGYNSNRTKVKFILGGVIGWVNSSEVQVLTYSEIENKNHSYYKNENGILKHYIYPNMNKDSHSTLTIGYSPDYLIEGNKYYSYDGHYFYDASNEEKFLSMLNDYNAGTRKNSLNVNNPYYNYFQYLPLRSKSNYTADDLNTIINNNTISSSKLRNLGQTFIDAQNKYGVNALVLLSIAVNESSWGTSNIAMTKNNLFGLNAVDSSPGQSANYYSDVRNCVKDMAQTYLSKQYLYSSNWKYFGGFLGDKASGCNVKYASDPYWGEKAAHFAWIIDNKNQNKDKEMYSIGIKDITNAKHTNLNIRKEATTNSVSLYTTGKQSNHSFIILDKNNDFYKIQSDSTLNDTRTSIFLNNGEYNFDNNYAYASSNYITEVITGKQLWLGNILYTYNQNGIDIGVNYSSNKTVQFKWQSYNLDTGVWESISQWSTSNWATWRPKKGNYWLHVEAKTSDGNTSSITINFRVDKDYTNDYSVDVKGLTWVVKDTGIDVGAAYESNDPNVQFKWQSYNLDTGVWENISQWTTSNWATWRPKKGNYWLHVEAKTSDGKTDSETVCFAVGKDY